MLGSLAKMLNFGELVIILDTLKINVMEEM